MALAATFGPDVMDIIHKCRVLVVGAGGIGCELLKNLVSSGFKDIETIDLDTIEVSNLNRQFLFRKRHVGSSKAEIAADAVKQFDASIKIQGHLGNIKAAKFGSEYFKSFDIVLNALDNTEARRHVNRVCLATNRSFVESGTQGFVGQVIPIIPKYTQCWECTPKQNNQRTYPVCTIRATPDKPVHCVVWAKLMFALLFGAQDDSNMIKDLKIEKEATEKIEDFAQKTFIHLYEKDIEEQLKMEDKWKDRKPPIVIKYDEMKTKWTATAKSKENNTDKRQVLDLELNAKHFIDTMSKLYARKEKMGELVFDKDDDLAMLFIASAANLRMHCYGIERKSEFDLKGIAGNIIHAIATTNAIVAAAMVVQAVHILKRDHKAKAEQKAAEEQKVEDERQRELELRKEAGRVCWVQTKGKRWLYPQFMEGPISDCFICQKSRVHLAIDPKLFTFGQFVKSILCKHLGFKQPDITVHFRVPDSETEKASNYIESIAEDDDEEDKQEKEANFQKALDDAAIKIYDDSELHIEDYSQNVNVILLVHYLDLDDEAHPTGFETVNTWDSSRFTLKKAEKDGDNTAAELNGNCNDHEENKENKKQEDKKAASSASSSNSSAKTAETGNKHIGKKRKEMDANCAENEVNEPPTKKLKTST